MKSFWHRLIALSWLLGAFLPGKAQTASQTAPDAQRGLTIYQIMVASFQHHPDGAVGYNAMWGPDGHRKNGNLLGIINSLDYIRDLGVNAIWLTPVFDSSTGFGGEKLQATGYFTNNYFKIDPHFGTMDEFRRLVDEAHKRGLYVILDGVFGHHGGVTEPSPSGHTIDCTISGNDRNEGTGNVAYPGSLDYFKEVATWWIDNYDIDGWRLDQAYQACQGNHNYWNEIRSAVEQTAARRQAEGKQWGTLGYMVGEDWGDAATINKGVYRNGGLLSAFDFQGKDLISGPMQKAQPAGLANGWKDVVTIYGKPTSRGYLSDNVLPNLFLTNHDGYRLADHFDPADPLYYEKQMTRIGILAGYNGPVTLYYGDEYADRTLDTTGGQPDNVARTSGHLEPRTDGERRLHDFTAQAMQFRRDNPAMWRGEPKFDLTDVAGANVLIVNKIDPQTGNHVLIVFSDADATVPVPGIGNINVNAWQPEFVKVK